MRLASGWLAVRLSVTGLLSFWAVSELGLKDSSTRNRKERDLPGPVGSLIRSFSYRNWALKDSWWSCGMLVDRPAPPMGAVAVLDSGAK